MRFIIAGIAFLISLVCFGTAAWQIVQAQSADSITAAGSTSTDAPLIVVPSETLVDNTGAQRVTISGDGPIVAVVGRQNDIAGWVADTAHDRAVVDEESGELVFESAEGTEPTAPNPLGNDLWFEEYSGENTLEFETTLPPGFSMIVASTGDQPAPSEVSVTWPLDGSAPWSGPLLVAGIVFLLVALGLLLWALLSLRRGIRPRRSGSAGPVNLRPSTSPVAEEIGPSRPTQHEAEELGVQGLAEPSTAETPAVAQTATHDDTSTIALASEPQPSPNATPTDADQASWAQPDGAWAAPQEPVSVPHAGATTTPPGADPEAAPLASRAWAQPGAHENPWAQSGAQSGTQENPWAQSTASEQQWAASGAQENPWAQVDAAHPAASDAATAPEPAYGIRTTDGGGAETPGSDGARGDDAKRDGTMQDDSRHDDSTQDDSKHDDSKHDDSDCGGGSAPPPYSPSATDSGDASKWKRPRGRDRSSAPKRTFRLAAILLVGGLGLTGCSANMWPEALGGAEENPTATPTSTVDEALLAEGAPMPALTEDQLANVLEDVRAVAAEADAAGDAAALEARFGGAALEARDAVYRSQAVDPALPGPMPVPNGEVVYSVPQATNEWPRSVFVVAEMGDAAEAGTAPAGMMLVQETARDQFRVQSLVQLAANVQLPEAAPMSIGAPGLTDLAGTLAIAPDQLAAAYGDVMLNGDASANAATFAIENDTFLPQVGQSYRDQQLAAIDQNASRLEFSNQPAAHAPLGVGTLDGGAIVAVSVQEIEKFSARTQLATLSVTGRAAALAGASESPYGFERIYTDQLLFHVPSAEAGGQVQFLGYSQTMTSARPLDQTEVTYDS